MKRQKSWVSFIAFAILVWYLLHSVSIKEKTAAIVSNSELKEATTEFEEHYEEISKDRDWHIFEEFMNGGDN